jgi:hypothetical protein
MRFFYLMLALAVVASSFNNIDALAETEETETALAPGV